MFCRTSLCLIFLLLCPSCLRSESTSLADFWNTPRHGANCFNKKVTSAWWAAAHSAGLDLVRLTFSKWQSAHRDFLIGNADRYEGLVQADLNILRSVLDTAQSYGLRVVLVPLSVPGARWRQQNGDRFDLRLWRDTTYRTQVCAFWHDLATALKGHPALAGYNVLNEPIPEKTAILQPDSAELAKWYATTLGTAADLNEFNRRVVRSIREVDATMPVILDAGWWANPNGFAYLTPLSDSLVYYSFHVYEPWNFTNRKANNGRIAYGRDSIAYQCSDREHWLVDMPLLQCIVEPVARWQARFHIPSTHIIAGEFGCHRMSPGADRYLTDLIDIFDTHGWHWAFYSFREDTWDGMDYEIGSRPLGENYWEAVERGDSPEPPRADNPLWRVIADHLIKTPTPR